MTQLIVTDYDGTLVIKDGEPSAAFYTKLNMLTSRGIIFAVASGRPYNQLKKLLFPASNEIVFISDDGAQMMYKNCVLYKLPMELNCAKVLCREALDNGITPIAALREENRKVTEERLNLPFFFSSDVFKLIMVKNGRDAECVKAKARECGARVCYEDDTYLELCNKSADKGEAVKRLMRKFSVKPQNAVVFGDGANDLPMLNLTDNRFTTPAGCDSVKAIATAIGSVQDYIIKNF